MRQNGQRPGTRWCGEHASGRYRFSEQSFQRAFKVLDAGQTVLMVARFVWLPSGEKVMIRLNKIPILKTYYFIEQLKSKIDLLDT